MRPTLQIRRATSEDLEWIYGLRHRVYAEELGQHQPQPSGTLRDNLDGENIYLVAAEGNHPIGFVSLTPPWVGRYSLDKYLTRDDMPLLDSGDAFEVRILTVEPAYRDRGIAMLLMYAALRWAASRGGQTIAAMGRAEVLAMYRTVGLEPTGRAVVSGDVRFEVMTATVAGLTQNSLGPFRSVLETLLSTVDWRLDVATWPRPDGCEHGGASFTAIGTDFRTLDRRREVVAADVLDAWFPPAPAVLEALRLDPAWMAKTSPPTDAVGLLREIAASRGLPIECLNVGAGSSDLIFRTFGRWLTSASRVLLVDPSYGEYVHVAERVIGAQVDRLRLSPNQGWHLDLDSLSSAVGSGQYDLVVVVNPNNPTGRHTPAASLRTVIQDAPPTTRWWIDEAYLGYVDLADSLADLATINPAVAVCTTLSKMYALSGMRAAFLVTSAEVAADIRAWTPPWAISLPAQIAAVAALRQPNYYQDCWSRTNELRRELAVDLAGLAEDVTVQDGAANFLTITLPPAGPSAAEFVAHCRSHDVFLRDLSALSPQFQGRTVRIAVQDSEANSRILTACRSALATPPVSG
ncbi:MAG: aminotransferase class I/II-fold pyridoxal phosphate-dependent enzyme [Ornithinimicrobium sp.]